ncbi:MAG: cytidine deaminase [Fimbriimonas ginsengisoli]|uniref:Cytidine deaminase n=1 Tax=Fimbriimonas ginsengisoli TaxID=1005039 RepID=A0A931PTE5_FIMGI|nr:cytidine deaminase [Fimbriimonas ginsengisoli]
MKSDQALWNDLIERAREARSRAYAPYSGYAVGAAILDAEGRVWTGCNVENASYGLSLCAERVAVARMVAAGSREIAALAVATRDGAPPCGLCLQTLIEFAPADASSLGVALAADEGHPRVFSLSDLLPHAFRTSRLRRTEAEGRSV